MKPTRSAQIQIQNSNIHARTSNTSYRRVHLFNTWGKYGHSSRTQSEEQTLSWLISSTPGANTAIPARRRVKSKHSVDSSLQHLGQIRPFQQDAEWRANTQLTHLFNTWGKYGHSSTTQSEEQTLSWLISSTPGANTAIPAGRKVKSKHSVDSSLQHLGQIRPFQQDAEWRANTQLTHLFNTWGKYGHSSTTQSEEQTLSWLISSTPGANTAIPARRRVKSKHSVDSSLQHLGQIRPFQQDAEWRANTQLTHLFNTWGKYGHSSTTQSEEQTLSWLISSTPGANTAIPAGRRVKSKHSVDSSLQHLGQIRPFQQDAEWRANTQLTLTQNRRRQHRTASTRWEKSHTQQSPGAHQEQQMEGNSLHASPRPRE